MISWQVQVSSLLWRKEILFFLYQPHSHSKRKRSGKINKANTGRRKYETTFRTLCRIIMAETFQFQVLENRTRKPLVFHVDVIRLVPLFDLEELLPVPTNHVPKGTDTRSSSFPFRTFTYTFLHLCIYDLLVRFGLFFHEVRQRRRRRNTCAQK